MTTRFPVANYKETAKAARKLGFYLARQAKGSHEIWRRDADSRQTTIPNHGKTPLKRRTLKAIFDDLGISADQFKKITIKK